MAETVGRQTYTAMVGTRAVFVQALYPTTGTYIQNIPTNWIQYQAVRGGALKAGSWPIVVFSHGYWECGNSAMLVAWTLAAEGAIVLCLDNSDWAGFCNQQAGSGPSTFVNIAVVLSTLFAPYYQDNMRAVITMGRAVYGNRQVMAVGHSVGGWGVCYLADSRITATLLLSPSSTNQLAAEYASVKTPLVVVFGGSEAFIGTAAETLIYDAASVPAYQNVIPLGSHYECCDRTRGNGLASIAAIRAADSRSELIASYATLWLKAFGPQADAASLTTLRAWPRVKE